MTYEQFWDGESDIARAYYKAFQKQRERRNEELWLQGMYIYSAILDIAPSLRPFSKESPKEYMKEPLPLTDDEVKAREERDEKKRQQRIREKFESFVADNNRKMKEANNSGL